MSFGSIQFTNRGRSLQAKAQTGTQLVFTRIAVGDGSLSGQAIADLTALVHEVKSITLNKLKVLTGGKAVAGGVLSNQDLANGFYWRELGLFAQDPDLGEILYCYGNAGDLAEYIPSPGGSEILERQVDIVAIIGNTSNVSATIEQSLVYATQEDIINLQQQIDNIDVTGTQIIVDQTQAPASPGNGTIAQLFNWISNRIKAITGKANWWDAPDTTLAAAKAHMDSDAPHAGHETLSGAQAKVDMHAGDSVKHITSAERNTWNAKQNAITGAASTITSSNLTANRALVSDGSGKVAVSGVTSTQLGYLSGVTSNIQTQLNAKLNSSAYTVADVVAKVKAADGAGSGIDADLWQGVGWVKPGNTVLYEYLPQRSFITGSKDAVIYLVRAPRPGRYRVTGELSTNKTDNGAKVWVVTHDLGAYGPGDDDRAASNIFETFSTTPVAFTLDMIRPVGLYEQFGLFLSRYATAYLSNFRISYSAGTINDNPASLEYVF